jgi:hypothetical protein
LVGPNCSVMGTGLLSRATGADIKSQMSFPSAVALIELGWMLCDDTFPVWCLMDVESSC